MKLHSSRPPARRRAERPGLLRGVGSRRLRAVLSLGAVAVLATGMSVKGTFAFWTDTATLQTGSFSSGTLDITLNGLLSGPANNGGTTTLNTAMLTNMVPGESFSFAFPVANAGNVPVRYTISGSATGELAPGMQYSVYPAGTANAATGSAANGNRAGTCTGTAVATDQILTGAPTLLTSTPRPLTSTPAQSESICIRVRLDPNAGNGLQTKSTVASFTFDATQVGAP